MLDAAVRVIGTPRILSPAGSLEAPGALGARLLVALALADGRPCSVEYLVDRIWNLDPPAKPKAALQTLVSRLRAASQPGVIESVPGGYRIAPAVVDLGVAAGAADQARTRLERGDAVGADSEAAEALEFWNDSATAESTAELGVLAPELRSKRDAVAQQLHRVRAEALLELGRYSDAEPLAAALADAEPGDEAATRLAMQALAGAGRSAEASERFHRFRRHLRETTGLDPTPSLRELHDQILGLAPSSGPMMVGLREAPNRLIGREEDLAQLAALIDDHRVVTIVGPGGIGKTRLAAETGWRTADRFDAVYLIELAAIRSSEDLLGAFAAVLGLREASVRRRADEPPIDAAALFRRIVAILGQRPTLLIVDNCEHLVDAVARMVEQIVEHAHSVRVLATSRAALMIPAEAVLVLEPLAGRTDGHTGPGVTLFVERARAVRPSAVLPPQAVAALVERLDGLPLAIELAAARIRAMSVEEIESALDDRFALLTNASRTAPDRHRTLEAVIGWSWNLLTDRQRALMRQVAPLPAGFDASFATALTEASASDVVDDLDALVGQSLLSVVDQPETGTVRYRMLETVREFGERELVRLGEQQANRRALVAVAVSFALRELPRLEGAEQLDSLARITVELENLVALLRVALEEPDERESVAVLFCLIGYCWSIHGAHEEVMAASPAVLDVLIDLKPQGLAPEVRLGAITSLTLIAGTLAYHNPRMSARGRILLRRFLRAGPEPTGRIGVLARFALHPTRVDARGIGDDPAGLSVLHLWEAMLAENGGDIELALEKAHAAYDTVASGGDAFSQLLAVSLLAQYCLQHQDFDAMGRWAREAVRLLNLLGAPEDELEMRGILIIESLTRGDLAGARAIVEEFAQLPGVAATVRETFGACMRAEIARWSGDLTTGHEEYRRAAELGPEPGEGPPGPAWVAPAAALSAAMVDDVGDRAWANKLAHTLYAHACAALRAPWDLPVTGAALIPISAYLIRCSDRPDLGVGLLAVASRCNSRQDLPAMWRDRHWVMARTIVGERACDDAIAVAADKPVAEQLEYARAILLETEDLFTGDTR